MSIPPSAPMLTLTLPDWLRDLQARSAASTYPAVEDRMRLAIEAARLGSAAGDGGPFGAAVFDASTNRLIAIGCNLVLATRCSVLHAEIVAIIEAQRVLGRNRMDTGDGTHYELVTSVEPCAMCLGAIVWAGVNRVVCGARDEDARAIGFDEGDKPRDWVAGYRRRGIVVEVDVLRADATRVLRDFKSTGGTLY